MKLHANTLPLGAPSPHTIWVLLETILRHNNLSFMDRHFLQLVSTAMGPKSAAPYANLFMSHHEETIWEAFIWAMPFWKRFIDDVFLIFIGTTKQLHSMKDFMNNLQPTIKFTFEHSTQEISFLDMKDPYRNRLQTVNNLQPLCVTSTLPLQPVTQMQRKNCFFAGSEI